MLAASVDAGASAAAFAYCARTPSGAITAVLLNFAEYAQTFQLQHPAGSAEAYVLAGATASIARGAPNATTLLATATSRSAFLNGVPLAGGAALRPRVLPGPASSLALPQLGAAFVVLPRKSGGVCG